MRRARPCLIFASTRTALHRLCERLRYMDRRTKLESEGLIKGARQLVAASQQLIDHLKGEVAEAEQLMVESKVAIEESDRLLRKPLGTRYGA